MRLYNDSSPLDVLRLARGLAHGKYQHSDSDADDCAQSVAYNMCMAGRELGGFVSYLRQARSPHSLVTASVKRDLKRTAERRERHRQALLRIGRPESGNDELESTRRGKTVALMLFERAMVRMRTSDDPRDAEALVIAYYLANGWSTVEMASDIGVSRSTVARMLTRSTKRLSQAVLHEAERIPFQELPKEIARELEKSRTTSHR